MNTPNISHLDALNINVNYLLCLSFIPAFIILFHSLFCSLFLCISLRRLSKSVCMCIVLCTECAKQWKSRWMAEQQQLTNTHTHTRISDTRTHFQRWIWRCIRCVVCICVVFDSFVWSSPILSIHYFWFISIFVEVFFFSITSFFSSLSCDNRYTIHGYFWCNYVSFANCFEHI